MEKIYELRKTPYYDIKPEIQCEGFGWFKTSVTYEDLKKAGFCFYKESSQPGTLIKLYKYGRNVFKVVF